MPCLVVWGTLGALSKLKSAANDLPTLARWHWANVVSAVLLKLVKLLIAGIRIYLFLRKGSYNLTVW